MRARVAMAALLLTFAVTACGEDRSGVVSRGDQATDGHGGVVQVLAANLRRGVSSSSQQPARSGDPVAVGELLTTDATGLGQLDYPDGSLTRIGPNSAYTVVELTATADARVVSGRLDVGDTWHRVKDSTASQSAYEVETPVGLAAVRGTAFAVGCTPAKVCTISVTEGTLVFRDRSGRETVIIAGLRASFDSSGPTAPPVAVDPREPWVAANTTRDAGGSPSAPGSASTEGVESFDVTLSGDLEDRIVEFDPTFPSSNCSWRPDDPKNPLYVGWAGRLTADRAIYIEFIVHGFTGAGTYTLRGDDAGTLYAAPRGFSAGTWHADIRGGQAMTVVVDPDLRSFHLSGPAYRSASDGYVPLNITGDVTCFRSVAS